MRCGGVREERQKTCEGCNMSGQAISIWSKINPSAIAHGAACGRQQAAGRGLLACHTGWDGKRSGCCGSSRGI